MTFESLDRVKLFCITAVACGLLLAGVLPVAAADEGPSDGLVFIVAADMRNFAADGEQSKNFSGACEAVKEVGAGAFMISPGDLDVHPPSAVRDMIDDVLGEDYPWYPVLGNHDPESPSTMRYLRKYNQTVPNVVNRGPEGCETTTFSFDWANTHFVVLNQYYDGVNDWGLKGDVVPELLEWLEADLAATPKKHIFVFGHEPLMAMPDMDNGRIRHQGDSLDENPENAFAFHQLLLKYGVDAYVCGHTHNTSYAKINGLWQIDAGHARGLEEASYADQMYEAIGRAIEEGLKRRHRRRETRCSQLLSGRRVPHRPVAQVPGVGGSARDPNPGSFLRRVCERSHRPRPLLRGPDRGPRSNAVLVLPGHSRRGRGVGGNLPRRRPRRTLHPEKDGAARLTGPIDPSPPIARPVTA